MFALLSETVDVGFAGVGLPSSFEGSQGRPPLSADRYAELIGRKKRGSR